MLEHWQWYQNPKTAVWYRTRPDDWFLHNRLTRRSSGYQVQTERFVRQYFQNRPARTAIDAGAHTGMTAVAYSGIFERVKAFEPIPELREQAEMTLHRNRCTNVELHPYGLGAETTETPFKYLPTSSFATHRNRKGTITAEIRCIDDFEIDRVDFIKIDVEGMEAEVIQGAWHTIESQRPMIQFEYKPNLARRFKHDMDQLICARLETLNYHIQDKRGLTYGKSREKDMFAMPNRPQGYHA